LDQAEQKCMHVIFCPFGSLEYPNLSANFKVVSSQR
jgi:hypothetical protein